MTWKMVYESFGHYIAVLVGCFMYRRMETFHKLMFAQVLVALPFLYLSYAVIRYEREHGMELNNLWVHNLYRLFEGSLFALGALVLCKTSREKMFLALLALVFLATLGFEYLATSNTVKFVYAFYAECLMVVLFYSYLLYQLLHNSSGPLRSQPKFWIFLGILLYYAADAPYMMLFNYLNEVNQPLNTFLNHIINNLLANIRYLLLTTGFLLLPPKVTPLKT